MTYAFDAGRDDVTGLDRYLHSLVADFSLTERLNYVFQSDYGSGSSTGGVGQWYGINNYLFYTVNDCWKLGTRFEWFRDDDGTRVVSAGALAGVGDYCGLTCGVNWKPTSNLNIRPELRYDWANGGVTPFNGGTADDQLSGGFDLIVTF